MRSPFRRSTRKGKGRRRPRSPIPYAIALLVLVVIGSYLAVTKDIPFVNNPFEIKAAFRDTDGIKPGSPVRIAGVNVGEVTDVAPTSPGARAATITMSITDAGRPIKTDATMKIRPRIFLEGNFFVDVSPGRPGSKELAQNGTIPASQTSNPVQFDQVLQALKSNVRADLRNTFAELAATDANGGGKAFNRSLDFQPAAYKFSAIVSEALLGEKTGDLRRFLGNQATVYSALDADPSALKGLITNFNTTAAALADRQASLRAALQELPITLRTALPTLTALNAAFPSVRRFAKIAVPGVTSTGPAVDALLPLIVQLRGLVSQGELRGLSKDLRAATPPLADFARTSVPLLGELRTLASCVSTTLVPAGNDKLTDPNFPATGPVYQEFPKSLTGLAGESRSSDANGQFFKVLGQGGLDTVSLGNGLLGAATRPMRGINPPPQKSVPPLMPNAPCENQQIPDLRTIPDAAPQQSKVNPADPKVLARTRRAAEVAATILRSQLKQQGDTKTKVSGVPATLDQIKAGIDGLGAGIAK